MWHFLLQDRCQRIKVSLVVFVMFLGTCQIRHFCLNHIISLSLFHLDFYTSALKVANFFFSIFRKINKDLKSWRNKKDLDTKYFGLLVNHGPNICFLLIFGLFFYQSCSWLNIKVVRNAKINISTYGTRTFFFFYCDIFLSGRVD